jgi:hypothetical protein
MTVNSTASAAMNGGDCSLETPTELLAAGAQRQQ